MYLLGTDEIGRLIKQLGDSYGFNLKYGHDFYGCEQIKLKTHDITYTITYHDIDEAWADYLEYEPTNGNWEEENIHMFNNGIDPKSVEIE